MEIVGVISAVPGLIEIIKAVTTAVRGLSKRKVAAKIAENLVLQFQDLEIILEDVEKRYRQGEPGQQRVQRLSTSLTELRTELVSLQHVLQTSRFTKEPSRYLKRAFFITASLDKTLNESLTRLAHIKASLTLLITHRQDSLTRDLLETSFTGRLLDLRALLRPSGDSFIPSKTPGTCDWIWSHPTFCAWLQHSSINPVSRLDRILCVYGTKGCGKSVLVKSISEQLRSRGEITLHFSFWAGSEAQRKLIDLLRTLVWQVLGNTTGDDLQRLSEPLISSPSIDERGLVNVIHSALSLIDQKVYFTIDAIDESIDDWNAQADGCLPTMLDLVEKNTNLHLLLASREPSLRTILKKSCPRLEITDSLIRGDIKRFIAAGLETSLTVDAPAIKDMVQESLEANSQAMFLWVTLVLKELSRCFSIEEVKRTLKQVPHDLDREYHRLFSQLMTRTCGTCSKPSMSMKRAKFLLSALLACPEPMKAEDLCYAFASAVNSSGIIEDDLITVDGITDACGDFLAVTEGRYHLIHASAADFLTRPEIDWKDEDSAISYFRVDLSEAQQSMCLSCFKYIKSIDLGYPLTDGRASSVPSRYLFFSYAIRFTPFHFVRVEENGEMIHGLSGFLETGHFSTFVEYLLVVTVQDSGPTMDFGSTYYWAELLIEIEWEDLKLGQAFNLESERRLKAFGAEDERYRSWLSLAILFSADARKELTVDLQSVTQFNTNRKLAPDRDRDVFPYLPRHLGALSEVFMGFANPDTDLPVSIAESLSIPMMFIGTVLAVEQNNLPITKALLAVSVRKTKKRGDFYELFSLFVLATLRFMTGVCNNDVEDMVRESIQIANRLPVQPRIQSIKTEAHELLVGVLVKNGKIEEAKEVVRSLEKLIGRNREKCQSLAWEYSLCHTRRGATYRVETLLDAATRLNGAKIYTDSTNLINQAIAILEESGYEPNDECMNLFLDSLTSLFEAEQFGKCVSCCLQLLDLLNKLEPGTYDIHSRWRVRFTQAQCLIRQGDTEEALEQYCEAADEIGRLGFDKVQADHEDGLYWLLEDLALVGQYGRSQSMARQLLGVKKIACKEDVLFGSIQSLFCKLKSSGSIESDCEEYLRCCYMLMVADEPQDIKEEADWWYGMSRSVRDKVPCFHKERVIGSLKYIDTCLRLDGSFMKVFEEYEHLTRFFVEKGDKMASDLVSSDFALRIWTDLSRESAECYFLASSIYLSAGRFSRCRSLLSSACLERVGRSITADDEFEADCNCASMHGRVIERYWEVLQGEEMRLEFIKQACQHLARAAQVRERIRSERAWRPKTDRNDDQDNAGEIGEERILDLQARLGVFGGGFIFDEAVAKLERSKLRRVKSEKLLKVVRVPQRRASIGSIRGAAGTNSIG